MLSLSGHCDSLYDSLCDSCDSWVVRLLGPRLLLVSHIAISSFLHRAQDTGPRLIMIHQSEASIRVTWSLSANQRPGHWTPPHNDTLHQGRLRDHRHRTNGNLKICVACIVTEDWVLPWNNFYDCQINERKWFITKLLYDVFSVNENLPTLAPVSGCTPLSLHCVLSPWWRQVTGLSPRSDQAPTDQNTGLWLAESYHVTWILASDWLTRPRLTGDTGAVSRVSPVHNCAA